MIQGASKPAGGAWTPAGPLELRKNREANPQVVDRFRRSRDRRLVSGPTASTPSSRPQTSPSGMGLVVQPVDLSAKGENAKEPQLAVDGSRQRGRGLDPPRRHRHDRPGRVPPARRRLGSRRRSLRSRGRRDRTADRGRPRRAARSRSGRGRSAESATVQAAEMAPGGNWLEAVDLSGAGDDATEPEVALAGGRAIAVWSLAGSAGPYTSIQSRERLGGGAWQPTQDLTQPGLTQTVVTPHVAIDPRGNAEAVWARSSASPTVIDGRTKPAGGAWTGIDELSELGFDRDSNRRSRSARPATGPRSGRAKTGPTRSSRRPASTAPARSSRRSRSRPRRRCASRSGSPPRPSTTGLR